MTLLQSAAVVLGGLIAANVLFVAALTWWNARRTHHCALCDAMAARPYLMGPFTAAEVETLRAYEHELTGKGAR